MKDDIAKMLVKSGCYINSNKNKQKDIKLPDGNRVIAYLSCRLAISDIKVREKIEEELTNEVKNIFDDDITVIGMATAGISWAHSIADKLDLPMLYMRGSEKTYGLKGLIEGNLKYATKKAIIVDDALNTGNTVEKAIEELKKHNIEPVGVVCIAVLKSKTREEIEKKNIKVIELTDYSNIINAALESGVLNQEEYQIMKNVYEE